MISLKGVEAPRTERLMDQREESSRGNTAAASKKSQRKKQGKAKSSGPSGKPPSGRCGGLFEIAECSADSG